jgi:phosphate transport system substrate-binding protein
MIFVGAAIIGAAASTAVASASAATIKEAGSSLVFPLAQIWSKSYTTNTVTTSSVGSGKGINLFQLGQVDIGASDAPMTSSQWGAVKASSPSDTVQIPWALSATGVGYNIPGIKSGLHLNATILAGIFSGTIKTWNDKQIVKLNPNFKKQLGKAGAISPIVRSDGSGDSYAFQHYLAVAAPKNWKYSYSTSWGSPAGTGENGNSGVAGAVKSNTGSIGYISAYYLITQKISTAAVQNQAGNFELPGLANISNAAASNSKLTAQGASFTGVSIVNPAKKYKTAYPISTYTYAIVNSKSSNIAAVKDFLTWATSSTGGLNKGTQLDFAPIPSGMQKTIHSLINSL